MPPFGIAMASIGTFSGSIFPLEIICNFLYTNRENFRMSPFGIVWHRMAPLFIFFIFFLVPTLRRGNAVRTLCVPNLNYAERSAGSFHAERWNKKGIFPRFSPIIFFSHFLNFFVFRTLIFLISLISMIIQQ